jgi:hypothetical protein
MPANPIYTPNILALPYCAYIDRKQRTNNLQIRKFLEQALYLTPNLDIVFTWPGLITAGSPSGFYYVIKQIRMTQLNLYASVRVTDPTNPITVGAFWNGTNIANVTIAAGQSSNQVQYNTYELGNPGDKLNTQITTYAGSVASDLTIRFQGFYQGPPTVSAVQV